MTNFQFTHNHCQDAYLSYLNMLQYGVLMLSAHNGRVYPNEILSQIATDPLNLRKLEDPYVDILLEKTHTLPISQIYAVYARAVVDLNRADTEIDPKLFSNMDTLDGSTSRVRQGLGVIPRIISSKNSIYNQQLPLSEARRRLNTYYYPFHNHVKLVLTQMYNKFGYTFLFDWHSCPSNLEDGSKCSDIILGDRYKTSCAPWVTEVVEQKFKELGFSVARNMPYAGGFITQNYSNTQQNQHALQIEINRKLYMKPNYFELSSQTTYIQNCIFKVILDVIAYIDENM